MKRFKTPESTPIYLRAPIDIDAILEAIAKAERRTKTAVLSLALEEYAERHHEPIYKKYKELVACSE